MNSLLSEILQSKKVKDENGEIHTLHSAIDENEIAFITQQIKNRKSVNSIEIGCAMGISSLAICEAISNNSESAHHVIVDPFQKEDWQNIGKSNLKKANFRNYTFYEERSEYLLPKLAEQNNKFDFAFIDGWHTFDHTLIDFFYLNRMLQTGGILIIDDVGMPSINKLARFIHTYPNYKYAGSVTFDLSKSRNVIESLKSVIKPFAKIFGEKISYEFFSSRLLKIDKDLGLNASMIAFEKIAEDERPWNWHKNF